MTATLRCFVTGPALAGGCIPGFTVNLSRFGVLVRCDNANSCGSRLLGVGDDVEIDIVLPSSRQEMPRSLHCYAAVTRVLSECDGTYYFAASIDEMQFRDLPMRFINMLMAAAATERVC